MIPIFIPYIEEKSNEIFFKKIFNLENSITAQKVTNIIEEYINKNDIDKEVVFYGESFSILNKEKQEELLSAVYQYLKEKKIKSIKIITEPRNINKEFIKILKKYKVKTVELNTESANNYILNRAKIKYKFEDIIKSAKLIRRARINLNFKMMIGMPESTKLDELNTAKQLIKLKPKIVKIYPVVVIKGTYLEKELLNGEYEPLTIVQAIERCRELTYLFIKKKIKVAENSIENITDKQITQEDIIKGPYHKDFNKLVESNIWYDSIVEKIKTFNVKVKEVEIRVNSENYESAVGYENENIEKLKELYNVDAIVIKDNEIKLGKMEVNIKKKFSDFLD